MNENEKSTTGGPEAKSGFQETLRLIDCFMEIIGYTRYLLAQIDQHPPTFETVSDHYKALFTRSQEKAREAKISTVEWKKGCFPVCAWVDEALLCSAWPEKGRWRSHQLQLRFFKTTKAGEEFYARLDRLKDKDHDVREVYLYCLALGFRGRFFSETDELHLAEVRTDHLLKLFPDDEAMSLPESLFPEGYVRQKAPKKGWKKGLSPVFFGILLVPPLILLALYLFFNLHLASLTHEFTRSLEANRPAVVRPENARPSAKIEKPRLIRPSTGAEKTTND